MMIDDIVSAYELAGGHSAGLHNSNTGSLVINENRVVRANAIPGVDVETKETSDGVDIRLRVRRGVRVENPLHLCFGVLSKKMAQKINIDLETEPDSQVSLQAHCVFPNAEEVLHAMDAVIRIGQNSRYTYHETHWHGDRGLVNVIPNAKIVLEQGAQFKNTFTLIQGAVGRIAFDYDVLCGDDSLCHMLAKVYGKFDDDIRIREKATLKGKNSSAILEARMVVQDRAKSEIYTEIVGEGDGARGHMDCVEIISGSHASARAVPIVVVTNDKAKITHEAAIGSVDRDQLNLLMSRGLTPDQATQVIVSGLLR